MESSFQSSVLEYLNSIPGCKAENVSGNAHQSGRPDINGCYKGRAFKIELKTTDRKYKTSQKQELELRRWKNSGCVVGVMYSMKALKLLFEKTDWNVTHEVFKSFYEGNDCNSWFCIPFKGVER